MLKNHLSEPYIERNSSSDIIDTLSSFAFLFLLEVDSVSLFMRYVVLAETEPTTFPP